MNQSLLPLWLVSLLPPRTSVDLNEGVRSCAGALLGILLTGMLSAFVLGYSTSAIWLMAPMGASAVLLFAAPASPLAQPWSIVGGNLVAALIGVSCAKLIAAPVPAAALAIGLAIGAMLALRCLHPPSGAVALTAVLGGPQIHAAGFGFALTPVALNSIVLLGVALLYNNATGRRYPHTQRVDSPHPHHTTDMLPTTRLGFTPDDLHTVLKEYNQVLDISADELDALFHQTEMHAFRRRFGETNCGAIMSKDVLSVDFATPLDEAWRLMREHAIQALPVIDRARRVVGIITRSDFVYHAELREGASFGARLKAFLIRNTSSHSDRPEVVGQVMSAPVKTVFAHTPIVELVPLMADVGLHHVPVIDAKRHLVGMVTQTDLVAALYETSLDRLKSA